VGGKLGLQDVSASVGRDEHDGQALIGSALDRMAGRRGVGVDESGFLGVGGATLDRKVEGFVHHLRGG
jgi:hypothetical protein